MSFVKVYGQKCGYINRDTITFIGLIKNKVKFGAFIVFTGISKKEVYEFDTELEAQRFIESIVGA